MISLSKTSC